MPSLQSAEGTQVSIIDMKRIIYILFFVLVASPALKAQEDTTEVLEAVQAVEKALTGNDSLALKKWLHPQLTFGHSNGWIQSKQQVIGDMVSGYLRYETMQRESLSIDRRKNRAIVKEFVVVTGQRGGTPFTVRLFILQQWVMTKKGWQLLVRQGAKQS